LAAALISSNAAASDTGGADLYAWIQGGADREILSSTTLLQQTWRTGTPMSTSRSRINLLGTMTATATAAGAEDGTYDTAGGGSTYLIDVITVNIPGADANQRTRIYFAVKGKGSLLRNYPTDDLSSASYQSKLCVGGTVDGPSCAADLPGWETDADLPDPSGLVQGTRIQYSVLLGQGESQKSFNGKATGYIIAQGPVATFALVGQTDAVAGAHKSGVINKATGTTTFAMTLPAGATCTSRSGQAFGGLCPAQ
jgi:hypothetical protein